MINSRIVIGTFAAAVGVGTAACKQRSESSAAGNLASKSQPPVRAESLSLPTPPATSETVPHARPPAESAAACCGGVGGMQGAHGMPGVHGMHGMANMHGTPGMHGMMGTAMMDSMQAHARTMSTMNPDQMAAMAPMHRQMVTKMLNQMASDMHDADVTPSTAWTATADSVREGVGRIPKMTKSQLKDAMPAQCAQVSRLIRMYNETMAAKR